MVRSAAYARCVFFQQPKAGNGFSRIQKGATRSSDGIDILPCHCRNTREMLHGIKRRAFCGEHGAGIAL